METRVVPGKRGLPTDMCGPNWLGMHCRAGQAFDVQFGLDIDQSRIRQRSVRGLSEGRSDVPHVVVDSGAATDGGLSVSEEIIGQPHARAEVVHRVVLDDGTKCKRVGEVVDYAWIASRSTRAACS